MKDFANVDADSDDDGERKGKERPKPPRFLRLCFYFPHKISDS